MNRLALTSTVIGSIIIVVRMPGLVAPDKFRAASLKFPRSVFWGRVLMAVAAVWVGIVMFAAADKDWPSWSRPAIVVGAPIACLLVIKYANQFLALRGLAVLLLLAAKVMVDAADTSELAAHHFRDLIGWSTANNIRCRAICALGVILGALLVVLGLLVY
jgi:hypothetical protein